MWVAKSIIQCNFLFCQYSGVLQEHAHMLNILSERIQNVYISQCGLFSMIEDEASLVCLSCVSKSLVEKQMHNTLT